MAPAGNKPVHTFSGTAYAKAVMHCCKHGSQPVLGVLLGHTVAKGLHVTDAIPLFHTHSLAPMLKAAFMIIEQRCRDIGDGLEIIGIYHATTSGHGDMNPVRSIADKVAQQFAGAVAWTFDVSRFSNSQAAFVGMQHVKDEWKSVGVEGAVVSEETLKQTARLISDMK